MELINWPPFSKDLNSVEASVELDGRLHREVFLDMSYDRLGIAVREAWDAVPEDGSMELLDSMPDRCKSCD